MRDSSIVFSARAVLLLVVCFGGALNAQESGRPKMGTKSTAPEFTLKTSVNRVIVDVAVKDSHGDSVHGLAKDDFLIEEDGKPQTILSFDAFNLDKGLDYAPPLFPAMPPNTFVNLPHNPERGPLYILFYDLVNIPVEDQASARAALVRFIQNKPAGTRFAIFVSSDGLHLVQGFTSDQRTLLSAVDPKDTKAHVPAIFLMGSNFGQGDKIATISVLDRMARFLATMPGRKNLIWFASDFPLSLFPSETESKDLQEEAKKTLNLLANSQIAVYPVDVSGVAIADVYAPQGDLGDGDTGTGSAAAPPSMGVAHGSSLLSRSYMTQDEIAKTTGGEAIYSSNKIVGSLIKVTEDGGNYYSLTYSPSNENFDGHLRHIQVNLKKGNYHLSYRRAYYGTKAPEVLDTEDGGISAIMKHGEPEIHQLIFGLKVAAMSTPAHGARKQVYRLTYRVVRQQSLSANETAPRFEIAAAVYDSDGRLLNSIVNVATEMHPKPWPVAKDPYRIEQELDVPVASKFLRVGVHDLQTGKAGALEISLPLFPAH